MRLAGKALSAALVLAGILAMTGCNFVGTKLSKKPVMDATTQTLAPVPVPDCAKETRDPVILNSCMDFGPDPMTMETRFQRTKACLVYADGGYARQLKLNKGVLITQAQWATLEDNRVLMLTLCIRYGRDKFATDDEVENSPVNILGIQIPPKQVVPSHPN